MKSYFLMLILSFTMVNNVFSQEKKVPVKFTSKLFFPFDIGVSIPTTHTNIESGLDIGSGIEYRFKQSNSLFIRLDYTMNSNNYQIQQRIGSTNVLNGSFDSNIFLAGLGYRIGSKKHKFNFAGRLSIGYNSYSYPVVDIVPNGYKITPKNELLNVVKFSFAVEYYLSPQFAFFIDTGYSLTGGNFFLEGSDYQYIQMKAGINAVLFNF